MSASDREAIFNERVRAGGAQTDWFKVEQYARSGSFSASDPLGQGVTDTPSYQMIPARVVWGGRTHRLTRPDGAGGYIFISVDATLMEIPDEYYEIMRDAKLVKVPQHTETGDQEMTCRVVDVSRSARGGTCTVRCTVDIPRQE